MTPPSDDPKIVFRLAKLDQVEAVLGVLNEAAAWLQDQGITQWPARFEPSWIEEAIRQGETWLVEAGSAIGGTVILDLPDPIWSDVTPAAPRNPLASGAARVSACSPAWPRETVSHTIHLRLLRRRPWAGATAFCFCFRGGLIRGRRARRRPPHPLREGLPAPRASPAGAAGIPLFSPRAAPE